MSPGRLAGIDALGRGLASLRANWPLVLVMTGGTLLVALVALAAMVPGLALVGLSLSELLVLLSASPAAAAVSPADLDVSGLEASALAMAALVFCAGLLAASLLQCWLQAGLLGTLWAADAQSPPGPRRPWLSFATFSPRLFAAEASRHFARLLGFYGLLIGLGLVWTLLLLGLVAAVVAAAQGLDGGAAFAIGCGGAIPLGFALLVLALAAAVGQADVPRPDGSALAAVKTGFRILGRRLGACALLYALYLTVVLAVATAEALASLASSFLSREAPAASLAIGGGLFLAQALVQTALTLALTAALIALVRAESASAASAT